MKFTFLGTSSGAPTKKRNVSALALNFQQTSEWMLFDCGEGTQHQLLYANYTLPKLRYIFLTHLHGDHCFGLFGLLASRGLHGSETPLTIVGPIGIKKMIDIVMRITSTGTRYPLEIIEINDEDFSMDIPFGKISCIKMEHQIPTYAFLIEENQREGEFNVKLAKEEGIDAGPVYGKLKKGETVILPDGRKFNGKDFVGESQRGRKIIIAGDNKNPNILAPFLQNCDLLIHEATYIESVKESLKTDFFHSTAAQVAQVSEDMKLNNLILTHFSARFIEKKDVCNKYQINDIHLEVEKFYSGNYFLANDFDSFYLNMKRKLIKYE